MILNDIFNAARERIGGKDEGEMQYRFPDSRLWVFYEQEYKPLLGRKVKMAECSFTTDQTLAIGTAKLKMGAADLRLTSVHRVETDGVTTVPLEVVSLESIQRDGNLPSVTGTPEKAYVFSLGADVYLGVYPVPDAVCTLRISGVGTPTSEFVYDSIADNRWETAGGVAAFNASTNMLTSRTTSVLPSQFFTSCAAFLAWKMKEIMEEYVGRPRVVEMAELSFQRQFLMDCGAFNMAVSGGRLQSRGITRRVRS